MSRLFARLRRDRRGATLMEFAIVAPVLLIVIMGLLDMTYRLYATAMLNGELQKVARDGSLQAAQAAGATAVLDQRVITGFRKVNGTVTAADFTFTRKNFSDFTSAGKLEPIVGTPATTICEPGRKYVDINNSNSRDDGGIDGQGGAKDAVLYTVRVTYKSLFPVNALYGASGTHTITASSVLRNQPWGAQAARAIGPERDC